jgi:hypothetical protein
MKKIILVLIALVSALPIYGQNKPEYGVPDTVVIDNAINLFVRKKNMSNSFVLSKNEYDKIRYFKVRKMLKNKEIYLTTWFIASYLDVSKKTSYSFSPNSRDNSEWVSVNKRISYIPVKATVFLRVEVSIDYYNKKEDSFEHRKIKSKTKDKKIYVVYPIR